MAAGRRHARRVFAEESLEDLFGPVCRDPFPVVDDAHHDAPAGPRHDDLDAPADRAVLDRIGEQIHEHLVKQVGVADDQGAVGIDLNRHLPRLGQALDLRGGLLDDRLEVEPGKRPVAR